MPRRAILLICLAIAPLVATAAPDRASPGEAIAQGWSDPPPISHYLARDGRRLAYRAYPGDGRVAILLHGSAGQSLFVHPLARSLHATGATVLAPDVRGHGASGPRGDIDRIGQLEDDLADLVVRVRRERPNARITLIGFSAGGAFALRAAGAPGGEAFDHVIALAPAFPFPSNVARPRTGGWARIDFPAMVLIGLANRMGIHAWDAHRVIAFAVPPDRASGSTPAYSYRLAMNYSVGDYRAAAREMPQPLTVVAGVEDQQFHAERYEAALRPAKPDLRVRLVPGLDHTGLITRPEGWAAVRTAFLDANP
ncbi:alpha/beta hydrolase [Phenylobacterium sp.]|uniref:alpha/beta hydrolase n=1 Tax=Phenylobacterium sp. TaxID=1871053 RepID=UPI0027369F84|nr:alpha/beta fold hydrolase [Phenylobacterium sp.]MDP3852279.1 alpha/beta fold hydrolase [Phenylobacterium sp.]